jgi:uncharacterized protein YkwD
MMLRRGLAVTGCCAILASALAVPAVAGSGTRVLKGCANADELFSGHLASQYDSAVVCLISAARRAQGLPAISASPQLGSAATSHSKDEARHGYGVSHNGTDGSTIASRIAASGYHSVAENEAILENVAGLITPYEGVQVLLAGSGSPCSTLLDPRFRDAGGGVAIGGHDLVYLTIDFGLRRGEAPPSHNNRPGASCPHTPALDGFEHAHGIKLTHQR